MFRGRENLRLGFYKNNDYCFYCDQFFMFHNCRSSGGNEEGGRERGKERAVVKRLCKDGRVCCRSARNKPGGHLAPEGQPGVLRTSSLSCSKMLTLSGRSVAPHSALHIPCPSGKNRRLRGKKRASFENRSAVVGNGRTCSPSNSGKAS